MSTFHIEHFGCRATQADAAALERQLLQRGCVPCAGAAAADVVVVSTCTVTAAADAQARDAIRHFHRSNPTARILVTGCYAQRAPQELAELAGVTWVVGNSHLAEIPRLLECGSSFILSPAERGEGLPPSKATALRPPGADSGPASRRTAHAAEPAKESFFPLVQLEAEPLSLEHGAAKILTGDIFEQTAVLVGPVEGGEDGHPTAASGGLETGTRPILKIQDGCNHRCAYCVIPLVRGRSRSLPPAEVLGEIRRLCAAGYKEVVLSGINLGSYGRDLAPRAGFGNLLRRIVEESPLERLRLSSIEPMDVTADLVELAAASGRIAPHFHVPLQSASDRILAAMHRWYRAAHYAQRLALIRERLPHAAIGADVIAGFPGETESDFRTTMDFVTAQPFTYLHVFAFSKRPGTAAANMPGEVPLQVVRERCRALRALAAEKSEKFRAAQVGRTLRVLTLNRQGPDWTEALSDNYLRVRLPGLWPRNLLLNAHITDSDGTHLLAGLADEPQRRRAIEM